LSVLSGYFPYSVRSGPGGVWKASGERGRRGEARPAGTVWKASGKHGKYGRDPRPAPGLAFRAFGLLSILCPKRTGRSVESERKARKEGRGASGRNSVESERKARKVWERPAPRSRPGFPCFRVTFHTLSEADRAECGKRAESAE